MCECVLVKYLICSAKRVFPLFSQTVLLLCLSTAMFINTFYYFHSVVSARNEKKSNSLCFSNVYCIRNVIQDCSYFVPYLPFLSLCFSNNVSPYFCILIFSLTIGTRNDCIHLCILKDVMENYSFVFCYTRICRSETA
jgi:hypothetical protein